MTEHAVDAARQQDAAAREYIRAAAGTDTRSAVDEVTRLAELRDRGVLSEAEFQQAKTIALS